MADHLEELVSRIQSLGDAFCESQMYCWPGFDPMDEEPEKFFAEQGIEFDGILMIRYPMKMTFRPISIDQIEKEERMIGVALPSDYKAVLREFGPVHLPGHAEIVIQTPSQALRSTRSVWCRDNSSLSVLAISSYHAHCDGNSIGFVRAGSAFLPTLFEFEHELVYEEDDPAKWTQARGDSLSAFLLDYLADVS